MVILVVVLEQISGGGGGWVNILNRQTAGKRVSPKVRKALIIFLVWPTRDRENYFKK